VAGTAGGTGGVVGRPPAGQRHPAALVRGHRRNGADGSHLGEAARRHRPLVVDDAADVDLVVLDLRLLDLPQAQAALQGVVMELDDCAFPLLTSIQTTDDPIIAFDDIDAAFLVGSRPRAKGMERRDLLAANAAIFKTHGAALNAVAKRSVKVLVVGNPCNTNGLDPLPNPPAVPNCRWSSPTGTRST